MWPGVGSLHPDHPGGLLLKQGWDPAPRFLNQRICIYNRFPRGPYSSPHTENLWSQPSAIGMAHIQFWPVRGGPGIQSASWRKGSPFPWTCCEARCKVRSCGSRSETVGKAIEAESQHKGEGLCVLQLLIPLLGLVRASDAPL